MTEGSSVCHPEALGSRELGAHVHPACARLAACCQSKEAVCTYAWPYITSCRHAKKMAGTHAKAESECAKDNCTHFVGPGECEPACERIVCSWLTKSLAACALHARDDSHVKQRKVHGDGKQTGARVCKALGNVQRHSKRATSRSTCSRDDVPKPNDGSCRLTRRLWVEALPVI